MDIFEAIQTRRSEAHLLPDEVPQEVIEKVLSAGLWAPNHHLTEPWHFYIFQGEERQKLADAIIENFYRDHPQHTEKELKRIRNKNPRRIGITPLVVVVTADEGKDAIETKENYAATVCAVQNILLAAHAEGLGVYWRTGEAVYTEPNAIKELLNVPQSTSIVAILLMGYPSVRKMIVRRSPLAEKVTWISAAK